MIIFIQISKADFQRYYAETLSGEERLKVATESQKNYELVYEGYKNIPNGENSAYALSCQLNLCVLLCDIFGDMRKAIDKANAVIFDRNLIDQLFFLILNLNSF